MSVTPINLNTIKRDEMLNAMKTQLGLDSTKELKAWVVAQETGDNPELQSLARDFKANARFLRNRKDVAKLFEVLQLNPDGLQQLKIREKSKGTARLPQIAKLVIWAIKFGRDHHYYAVQAAEGFDWKGRSPKRAADLIRLANDLIAATALLEEADKSQDKAA